ncbi:sulfur transfer protein involved in thiamine biosynthesis [Beggiatoa alba B18LD]|uniref:Sulfur transfer protein involved in thiamine biosynthesis n=1 Tax=Beggiatoa alba B18LD TaxID=395493 RepID=I3CKT3_9GAMM|nr:MoaD/ThiS family protein [Beggiatoa alba]EIJ44226.1 sulfur transfer protein involved in thiamine biosynthesis [Beggiatoa alba B18LD]
MLITLKLYASLAQYLPTGAKRNQTELDIAEGTSLQDLITTHHIPEQSAHLVLINGVYVAPDKRASARLNQGDIVVMFPPVAGG